MKKIFGILVLMALVQGCSKGSGTYVGQVVDAGWEGWLFSSCEVEFRTSDQASTSSPASSTDKVLCDFLQANVGTKFKVKWRHYRPNFTTESPYIIESVEEVK